VSRIARSNAEAAGPGPPARSAGERLTRSALARSFRPPWDLVLFHQHDHAGRVGAVTLGYFYRRKALIPIESFERSFVDAFSQRRRTHSAIARARLFSVNPASLAQQAMRPQEEPSAAESNEGRRAAVRGGPSPFSLCRKVRLRLSNPLQRTRRICSAGGVRAFSQNPPGQRSRGAEPSRAPAASPTLTPVPPSSTRHFRCRHVRRGRMGCAPGIVC